MKLKDVIRGIRKEYDIEEITIISADRIEFSGTLEQWDAPRGSMAMYAIEVERSEVVKRMMLNNRKAFLFIGNPFETTRID